MAAPAVRAARKSFTVALKDSDDESGRLIALVSAFGVVDDQDEELMPGAFKSAIERAGGLPFPFMWHHKWDDLGAHLGGFSAEETDEGLVIDVQFDMEDPDGVKAYRLVKSGRVREFSIGGFEPVEGIRREKRGNRDIWAIYEFDLVEVSLVLRGSNPATRVIDVKSAAELVAAAADETVHTGAAVVLLPAADDPVVAASSEPAHVTLAWLGLAADLGDEATAAILAEVEALAASTSQLATAPTGRGELGRDHADVVFVEAGALADVRAALLADGSAVRAAYDAVEQFPEWTPHITLGYPATPPAGEYSAAEHDAIAFDRVAVWLGDRREEFTLAAEAEKGATPPDTARQQKAAELINLTMTANRAEKGDSL